MLRPCSLKVFFTNELLDRIFFASHWTKMWSEFTSSHPLFKYEWNTCVSYWEQKSFKQWPPVYQQKNKNQSPFYKHGLYTNAGFLNQGSADPEWSLVYLQGAPGSKQYIKLSMCRQLVIKVKINLFSMRDNREKKYPASDCSGAEKSLTSSHQGSKVKMGMLVRDDIEKLRSTEVKITTNVFTQWPLKQWTMSNEEQQDFFHEEERNSFIIRWCSWRITDSEVQTSHPGNRLPPESVNHSVMQSGTELRCLRCLSQWER